MTVALKVIQPAAQSLELNDELNKVFEHEEAAHDKRNWVRLSYDCNNRCTFCLDSNAHDGTMRANDEIKVQIVEGRKKGMTRLILSGGEPTMHPNFLDFVLLGKKAGYRKVQTVTNGRMFSYPEFLDRAAKNGLDEITFSLHGHTAKLHDALVGTPGAFEQETKGLRAALASGRFIVNVDVVINKMNVKHLPEMLDKFIEWGVKEFDLLHIIPFGNAWTEARHHLFYDLDAHHDHLQRAFAYSKRPDVHIWLNRFPPQHAEGFEELIQDPYKLNDEVRGRREEYDRYLSIGQKLMCRQPERCQYCYLAPLCDALDEVIDTRKASEVDVVRHEGAPLAAGKLPEAPLARIVASDMAAAKVLAEAAKSPAIELDLDGYTGLAEAIADGTVFGKRLERAYAKDAASMTALLAIPGDFEVAVRLTKETAPAIRALSPLPSRLAVVQPNYDRVTEQRQHDVDDVKAFFASLEGPVKTDNVPRCLSKRPAKRHLRVLDTAMLGADARVDMTKFTKRYVTDGFYTKSLRCRQCVENESCRGVHINFVRAHGYAPLEPIAG
jgi:MoaA/NifB/PqqE/SkfB family radical SAM enzyme